MKLLLDTQMLLWAIFWPELLPEKVRRMIADDNNDLFFSPASLWEVSIKSSQKKEGFQIDAGIMLRQLLEAGYVEMPINSLHAVAINTMPLLHKDPFDRILIAQAKVESMPLLTCDAKIAEYPAPVEFIHK